MLVKGGTANKLRNNYIISTYCLLGSALITLQICLAILDKNTTIKTSTKIYLKLE